MEPSGVTHSRALGTIAFVAATLVGDASSALTIYRFGGDELPAPSEAELEGVQFIQRSWLEPVDEELGGEVYQADLSDGTLRVLRFDPDVNIAPTARHRGGGIRESTRLANDEKAVDEDLTTTWNPGQYLCANYNPNVVGSQPCYANTDYYAAGPPYHEGGKGQWFIGGGYGLGGWTLALGGMLYIDRVRIITGLEDDATVMSTFKLLANSGWSRLDGSTGPVTRVYEVIADVRNNTGKILEYRFPSHKRFWYLSIIFGEHNREWAVQEVEVYARGCVDRTSYVSEIIDLEDDMAFGDLRWSSRQDPGTELRLHTRSGHTADQNKYWKHDGLGGRVQAEDAEAYDDLALGEEAGVTFDLDNWTFWSAPYDLADSSGTPVVSPSPRRFLQFKVDMIPTAESVAELELLELRVGAALASALVGEVSPTQAPVAVAEDFTYYLRPSITGDNPGFDGLEMRSSSVINGVKAVRIGGVEWPAEVIPLDAEGAVLPAFPTHRFELTLVDTKLVVADSGTPLEIDFEARVLRSGAPFDVRVFDTAQPLAVRQKVEPGDADTRFEGNVVTVSTTATVTSLLLTQVSPTVFTPNGDGVNDVATIAYDLLEIIGAATVQIEISDLTGRVVRRVYGGDDQVGHYERAWNGRDDAGALVPPGIYLYRVNVGADRDDGARIGVVNVAY